MDLRQIAKKLGLAFKVFIDFLAFLFGRRQARELIVPEKASTAHFNITIRMDFRNAVMGLKYVVDGGIKPAHNYKLTHS